jgi:hypothetical protein
MYLNNFTCIEDVISLFQISDTAIYPHEVVLAWYGNGDYCGSAYVLFVRDGKLWEVHASHCSCNGIEGQWDPYETSLPTLEHFLEKGTYGTYEGEDLYQSILKKLIGELKKEMR